MGTQTEIAGSSPVAARLSPRVEGQPAGPCIRMSLTNPPAPITERGPATNFDHGRIEERRHVVCHKVDWLFPDLRYRDALRFLGPRADTPDVAFLIGKSLGIGHRLGLRRKTTPADERQSSEADKQHRGRRNFRDRRRGLRVTDIRERAATGRIRRRVGTWTPASVSKVGGRGKSAVDDRRGYLASDARGRKGPLDHSHGQVMAKLFCAAIISKICCAFR